jgi:peptidoglycan/xylan/chitin deacetylase (PgdA/CDA1 family)
MTPGRRRLASASLLGLALCAAPAARAAGPFSLFATTAPGANQTVNDPNSVELGMRLRPTQDGTITGLRFYKFPANNGPHSGRLWSNGGALLGTLSFTGETASGWQTALFASPIAVTSGTTYVASYHTNTGYAATRFYFTQPRDVPPLHAPASAAGALNGVYRYGPTPAFPTQSTRQSNYWVDVLFTTPDPASTACVTSSGGAWQNRAFTAQNGQFDAAFEATPGQNGMDGQIGLSNGAADAFTDLASIVRFNGAGFIDARDGGAYAASLAVPYTAGETYRFRLRVNVQTHQYSVFVSTPGGGERLLASQFDFRTEQAAAAQLNNAGVRGSPGALTMCHLTVAPVSAGPPPVLSSISPSSATAGGAGFILRAFGNTFTSSSLLRWNGSPRPTTFISTGELRADISAADIASPGTAVVTVLEPPSGAESQAAYFVIRGAPTAQWTITGTANGGDTATKLADGRVLATEGTAEQPNAPSAFYTRASGSWTPAGATGPGFGREAIQLREDFGGRVLITGGAVQECCLETAELFDPAVGSGTATGSMNFQRRFHTMTPLRQGQILVAGGRADDDADSRATAETYEPRTGVWTNVASMSRGRQGHTATLLLDDDVLVSGGRVRDVNAVPMVDSVTETAERFTGSAWAGAAPMSVPRLDHEAVRLADGRVLVMGGASSPGGPALASAELYDSGADSWSPAAPMATPRVNFAATLLANGRVLVTGGQPRQGFAPSYNSAEIYDPATDSWSPAGFMNRGYSNHNALLLDTGEVLVVSGGGQAELFRSEPIPVLTGLAPGARAAGGTAFTLTVRGESFVPGSIVRWNGASRTTAFVSVSTLTAQITAADIDAVRTASITVLNPGPGGGVSNVETFIVFDGSASWVPAARMRFPRSGVTATRLNNGRVFVTGSHDEFGVPPEVYDPPSDSWGVAVGTSLHTSEHASVLLSNGKVLVAGGGFPGNGECCQSDADLYDPATNVFSPTGSMGRARGAFTATRLPDGRVLAAGGWENNDFTVGSPTAELYDSTTGVWSNTGSMAVPRSEHAAALLDDGRVLVSGGENENGIFVASAELYDPATGAWSNTGAMNGVRVGHTATRLNDGRVLVAGGRDNTFTAIASAELFNPATGAWTAAASMSKARNSHTATLLPDGRVLVAGDGDSELFDPASGTWTPGGAMVARRQGHDAAVLLDGRVLAVSGSNGEPGSVSDGRGAELFRPVAASTAPRSALAVSLTFDDGSAGQAQAGQILASRGLKGTFYVNSAQLGTSGFYMTLADVQALAAAGHEVGGHTLHHVDLTTVTATEARRQVCEDRAQLAAWGLDPASFAYPFGRFNDPVKGFVRDCGYASGRAVDAGFSVAESSPPADAYAIRTPDAITSSQTLSALQGLVLAAEQGGGGWLPLVFHQICSGCSPLSTSSATLAAFADWLASRGPLTTVRTVREMVPPLSGAFTDAFAQPDGLITNENPASPRSQKWLVTEGSLFADGGQGWTGVPDNAAPNAASSNGTGSALFRAQTVPNGLGSDVSLRFTVSSFVSVLAPQAYDGVHLWLRFLDAQNYYHISLRRRDDRAAIKKRRNGVISTFNTPLYGAPALGTPQTARAVATTNPNGSVTIQVFLNGVLAASAVDTANPIVGLGRVVVAGENVNFRFDDFTVASAPASGMSVASADAGEMSFAPASLLVRDAYGARVERIDGTGAYVPEGALGRDAEVTVGRADESKDADAKGRSRREQGLAAAADEIEFGPSTLSFAQPVTVALGYEPRRLETSGLREDELKVYSWDATLAQWRALPSVVDREARTVSALTDRFSVYQAMGPGGIAPLAADPSFGWKALYAFPNPARGTSRVGVLAQPGIVDSVEIAVYDLSGRKVHSSSDFRFGGAVDDGNGLGAQFTYGHVWDVSGVASGVYTYVVTARKAGEGEKRKAGKLAVIK